MTAGSSDVEEPSSVVGTALTAGPANRKAPVPGWPMTRGVDDRASDGPRTLLDVETGADREGVAAVGNGTAMALAGGAGGDASGGASASNSTVSGSSSDVGSC